MTERMNNNTFEDYKESYWTPYVALYDEAERARKAEKNLLNDMKMMKANVENLNANLTRSVETNQVNFRIREKLEKENAHLRLSNAIKNRQ